jgi:phosphoserine phosphatase
MTVRIQIISFDLDGVLYDGVSSVHPVAKEIGIEKEFMQALKRVREGKMNFHDAIREGCKIWQGVPTDGTLDLLVHNVPLMKGAAETVSTLQSWGFEVGCISSGVSQFYMGPLMDRLNLDFGYSNVLGESDGVHDGTVHYVMDGPGKAETALKHLQEKGLTSENLACVGDGTNDIALFGVSTFSIAFNPESPEVSAAASVTLHSKDLRAILPYFAPRT